MPAYSIIIITITMFLRQFFIHGKPILLSFLTAFLLLSCSLVNTDDKEIIPCILSEIKYDAFNSLKFQTISGGRIYNISQLFTEDDEPTIIASFQFNYFEDLISIVDQDNPSANEAFMTIRLENDRPYQVLRYFQASGVRLFHDITYPETGKIRVDLTREASTGDILYVGYSLYHLNSDGNVVQNERFVASDEEPSGFEKVQDRSFTYDSNPSPQINLFLPFFADTNFPDVKFFSVNNILTISENNQTIQFQYEYGLNNEVVTQTLPTGQSLIFLYANCPDGA